jgi:hypothetical protein
MPIIPLIYLGGGILSLFGAGYAATQIKKAEGSMINLLIVGSVVGLLIIDKGRVLKIIAKRIK